MKLLNFFIFFIFQFLVVTSKGEGHAPNLDHHSRLSACDLKIMFQDFGRCDPKNNEFIQKIAIVFSGSAQDLLINGNIVRQVSSPYIYDFKIKSFGQTEKLVVSFVNDSLCTANLMVQVPANCCPFDLKLDSIYYGCQGQNLIVKAEQNLGFYNWFDSNNNLLSTEDSVSLKTNGRYKLIVTSLTGCSREGVFTVDFRTRPTIILPTNTLVCDGVDYKILPQTNGLFYEWLKDGVKVPDINTISINTKEAGTFTFVTYFSELCKSSTNIILSRKTVPKPSLGNDVSLCQGETVTLRTSESGSATWFKNNIQIPGQFLKTLNVKDSGVYKIVLRGANDCLGEDSSVVKVFDKPSIELGRDTFLCGDNNLILKSLTNGINLKWFKNDNPIFDTSQFLKINQIGKYKLMVSSRLLEACTASDSIEVKNGILPFVNLPDTLFSCISDTVNGVEVSLPIQDFISYQWSLNGKIISNSRQIRVKNSGNYVAKISNKFGCEILDSTYVLFDAFPQIKLSVASKSACVGDTIPITINGNQDGLKWFKNGVALSNDNQAFFNASAQGRYSIEKSGNCTFRDSIDLVFNVRPQVDIKDTILCGVPSFRYLNPQPAFSSTWVNFNSGLKINSNSFEVNQSGKFILLIDNQGFCKVVDTFNIELSKIPTLVIDDSVSICSGIAKNIFLKTDGEVIKWYLDNTLIQEQTSILRVSQAGKFSVFVSDKNGFCNSSKDIIAMQAISPIFDLGADKTTCYPLYIKPVSKIAGQYVWIKDQVKISDRDSIFVSESGKYFLTVTLGQCSTIDSVSIVKNKIPTLFISMDSIVLCNQESKLISVASDGNVFQWFTNGNPIIGQNKKDLQVDKPGRYVIEVSLDNQCPVSKEVIVLQSNLTTVNLGRDTALCNSDSLLLVIDIPNTSNTWSDGSKGKTLIAKSGVGVKTYFVEVKNRLGCIVTDTIKVFNSTPQPFNILLDKTNLCLGDTSLLTLKGREDFEWVNLENFIKKSSKEFLVFPSENIKYTAISKNNCSKKNDTISINLSVIQLPDLLDVKDSCLERGVKLTLKAKPGYAYSWEPKSLFVNANSANVSLVAEMDTIITLKATDKNGCSRVDTFELCVIQPVSMDQIKKINIITPNEDGVNDVLLFDEVIGQEQNYLSIYNRWGGLVFEKKNYQWDDERFDGTKQGELLPADVYYYVLKVNDFVIKSSLTIMR
jgi:gliding motility-associated-like protein